MNAIDIVILLLSIAIVIAILVFFAYSKRKGKHLSCNCGKRPLSGKTLVKEYRKAHPKDQCPCCKDKD